MEGNTTNIMWWKRHWKMQRCWNTQENENAPMKFVYFERGIEAFEIIDESNLESTVENSSHSMQALKIDGSEIPHNSIKTKKGEAKQRELVSW